MSIYNKITAEQEEALAELWASSDFQILVNLLKQRRENLAFDCLTNRDMAVVQENQIEGVVISRLLKSVKDAADRVNEREKSKSLT